jgi:tetratricopeptide (TPR) repeat protein
MRTRSTERRLKAGGSQDWLPHPSKVGRAIVPAAAFQAAFAACILSMTLAAQTPDQCAALRKHGDNGEATCYQGLVRSPNPAFQAEGYWGLRQYPEADAAFSAAVKAHPKDPNLLVRWGRFLFELPNGKPDNGEPEFEAALKIDKANAQALLGMALVAADNYGAAAVKYAEQALESDPKLYEAREVLARVALEDNNEAKAREEANKAIAISPEALDAMAILATADWLDDKPAPPPKGSILTTSPWIDRIFKVNPHYGEAYATAGHFFVINRMYEEGIQYYRKALEIEPSLLSAKSELGINLMRLGKEAEAKRLLLEDWNAGFKDLPTQNTLNLMTSYKNFDDIETPTTVLKMNKKEEDLLKPYLQAELDKIIATYNKKYKYTLTGQVHVEAYPDHEDFAVRTMGMPGLGALGVTFGNVVAMDSPSASDPQRKPGSFHWASTLWHEMSHVYVLSMTDHRVPRWFTEGLAVYEETAIYPEWGDRLDHPSIMAIKEKKLLPVAELDRGFIHPSYPEQVIVSYYQGGRVITYIVEKWGYDKVLDMIHDYANRMTTPEVIEKELKMKPEDFDKQFLPWLEAQTKTTVDGFDEWAKRLKALNASAGAKGDKDWDAIIKEGTAIRDMYSDYVEAGSVYEILSRAYLAKNDKAKATEQLKRYSDVGGRDPVLLDQLADLQVEAGNKRGAVTTLERVNFIYLRDDKGHQKLGDLYMELGNPGGAIREYAAVLAMKPVDQAGSHFQLAKALQAAKRPAEAREEVFSALEAAPSYKPAQKLLLELSGTDTNVKQ